MQLSYRQAPVRSCTRIFPRTSVVCGPQYRATTVATARSGAVGREVSCSAAAASGGSPPKPPKQDKALGGGDQPEDASATQDWLQGAIDKALGGAQPALGGAQPYLAFGAVVAFFLHGVVAFVPSVRRLFALFSSLATKAGVELTVKESGGRLEKSTANVGGGLEKSTTDPGGWLAKSITDAGGRLEKSINAVQQTVGRNTIVAVHAIVNVFVCHIVAGRYLRS